MVTDRIRNRLVQFENGPKSNNYSRFPEPNRLAGPGTPYGWDSGPQVFDEDDPAIQGYRPNAGWGELVGSRIEQGTVDGVSGYDADLWGLVFGYDGALNATTRAGVAFGYSNTDIADRRHNGASGRYSTRLPPGRVMTRLPEPSPQSSVSGSRRLASVSGAEGCAGPYEVVCQLLERDGQFQYRIKSGCEPFYRTVKETSWRSDLRRDGHRPPPPTEPTCMSAGAARPRLRVA